ncbi:MAG: metal ABC transporter permease [Deltaproteobacteria bacterium]|nr:metal ABC transporter permease [Deltaproteobacteria bacterium]
MIESIARTFAGLAERGLLPEAFGYVFLVRGLLAILLIGPLLGGLSHLVSARRLAFLSAALGHASLTGVAIGILLGESITGPHFALFGFCVLAGLWMTFAKRHTQLPSDTLIGVFLAGSLGLGITLLVAVTRSFNIHQIEGVMFGSLLTVTDLDLAILAAGGAIVGLVIGWSYNDLLLDSVSSELAYAKGARTAMLDYLFVLLLTISIVVSIKIIGALLVEAFVIVPAAAARNVARNVRSTVVISILVAWVSGVIGIFISSISPVPTGGAVVLVMTAFFALTLLTAIFRRR